MKTLIIDVGCYIEDAEINGVEDSPDKILMPFLTYTGLYLKIDNNGAIQKWNSDAVIKWFADKAQEASNAGK